MSDYELRAPVGATKKRKRVGRGAASGQGTTAGRGNKGQQSRSGGKVYIGFEGGQMPLYRRIAQRGFSNYRFRQDYAILNLRDLEKKFAEGETVDMAALIKKGLIKNAKLPVKILGTGEVTRKLTVVAAKISASAKEKIEKAGGSVTLKA